ncbi:hypothetical protein [Spiroplasma endosymbiont of Amphimallon solstitiale]|uniref:hypothetical protein n=1 Tax=Spiroplasma endosymbiont of Amphimallon solstitiale TaxID=3066288 RepID=UPI00313C2216
MKIWIKTNLSKITLALALTGAVSGVTSLIIGSLAHHKTNDLTYYLDHNKQVVLGTSTIWQENVGGEHKIRLYFDIVKHNNDIKWNGIYPNGYFNK